VGIDKVNSERAYVRHGGFHRGVDETPVVSVVWAVDAPVGIGANSGPGDSLLRGKPKKRQLVLAGYLVIGQLL
jgi:hypothetical protein